MNLKRVDEVPNNCKVFLRLDLDLPISEGQITDNSRLTKSIPMIKKLIDKNCKLIVAGKLGRPGGKFEALLTLKPVYLELMATLGEVGSVFIDDVLDIDKIDAAIDANQIVFLENLRFWKGEEENDGEFAKYLAGLAEVFVNDAIAMAHREEASVCLHRLMPAYYGDNFVDEIEAMERVRLGTRRPVVILLGGAKKDKLEYLPGLEQMADKILIGGKLPQILRQAQDDKIIVGHLTEDGLDINEETIEKFTEVINGAGTVVWAGAMGFFEDEKHRNGTNKMALAVANCLAYKVIAGGDTGASVKNLGLMDRIDFICSGGGVMLEYLSRGSLAAIE